METKTILVVGLLLAVNIFSQDAAADKLFDFLSVEMKNFGEWLEKGNNSGNPASQNLLEFENIPVFDLATGADLGSVTAYFNYSVVTSGPQNFTISPLTSLENRQFGIRLQYNWTYFYGIHDTEGSMTCDGTIIPINGNGAFDLGKDKNFFGVTGMGYTNFTLNEDGHIDLSPARHQRYFVVDENSGMDKFSMENLSAGSCGPNVRASILVSLREQLGASVDTIHPGPLYRQIADFLGEIFAKTPVSEM